MEICTQYIDTGRKKTMAMPQRDNYIEQIQRLVGLMAWAEAHQDWDELEKLKNRLKKLLDKMS